MACQILERNYEEQRILLAGIRHGGEGVAVRLARELIELNPGLGVDVTFIALDKSQPELSTVDIGVDVSLWSKGVVVVVDGVILLCQQ